MIPIMKRIDFDQMGDWIDGLCALGLFLMIYPTMTNIKCDEYC